MYDAKDLYNLGMVKATDQYFENKDLRTFQLSRGLSPGGGTVSQHWTGDNFSTWENMRESIVSLLNFGLWGINQNGADICGFSA